MSTASPHRDNSPWYRHFWPWFLFTLPAIVVVAAFATLIIANRGADDLVAADYYKDGLAINQRLEKETNAQAMGLSATLTLQQGSIAVAIEGPTESARLQLTLSHRMEADRDIDLVLLRTAQGRYSAPLDETLRGSWHWSVEPYYAGKSESPADGAENWRINGVYSLRELPSESQPN